MCVLLMHIPCTFLHLLRLILYMNPCLIVLAYVEKTKVIVKLQEVNMHFEPKRKLQFYFRSMLQRTCSTFCEYVTTIVPRNVCGKVKTHMSIMASIQDTLFLRLQSKVVYHIRICMQTSFWNVYDAISYSLLLCNLNVKMWVCSIFKR